MSGPGDARTSLALADPGERTDVAKRTCSIEGCPDIHEARGWCHLHYNRWRRHGDPLFVAFTRGDDDARLLSYIDKNGAVPDYAPHLGPCWTWLSVVEPSGYGKFSALLPDGTRRGFRAHRYVYERFVGPIPDGLVLDHLCRVKTCVRPAHLEPVTDRENIVRGTSPVAENVVKTHCKNGHEFTAANTSIEGDGSRRCRQCSADRAYERYRAKNPGAPHRRRRRTP